MPRPEAKVMLAKPSVIPSICGTARRKPKFAADAVTITTFGPSVRHKAIANVANGPSKTFSTIAMLSVDVMASLAVADRGRHYRGAINADQLRAR